MTNNSNVRFRAIGGALLLTGLLSLLSAGPAAGSVWWSMSQDTWPAVLPTGGEGKVVVVAENRGYTKLASGELVARDKLPAGLTPQPQGVELFLSDYSYLSNFGGSFCSVTGQDVECRVSEAFLSAFPMQPFDGLEMRIAVKLEGAASGAENEASVAGAGTPTAAIRRPVEIGSNPAAFGVSSFEFAPENMDGSIDTQAGSHPYQLTTTLTLNQTSDVVAPPSLVKDLNFHLPAGLIGNPTVLPQCSSLQFTSLKGDFPRLINACPEDTAVGVAAITVSEPDFIGKGYTFPVPLFNLTPSVGEPARFGFIVVGVPVILDTSVRTGGDYGVTVSVKNITELANLIGSRVTFWGVPGIRAMTIRAAGVASAEANTLNFPTRLPVSR